MDKLKKYCYQNVLCEEHSRESKEPLKGPEARNQFGMFQEPGGNCGWKGVERKCDMREGKGLLAFFINCYLPSA